MTAMEDRERLQIIVSGRVQGVFFRDFTRQNARSLGITGWVRNLPTGQVEIVAEGTTDKLKQLIEIVRVGPKYARVDDLKLKWEKASDEFTDFQIVY